MNLPVPPRPRIVYVAAAVSALLFLVALGRCLAGCATLAAAAPALEQAGEGIVALVTAELQAARIPPTDPAYLAALAGARALEAESADAGAAIQAKLDSLLGEVRARRRCPSGASPDAGAPPAASPPPAAPAPAVAAGPWPPDAGPEGGR